MSHLQTTRKHIMNNEEYLCIEPEAGKDLLFRYPEFLSQEEQEQFKLHLSICDYCQEQWNMWRSMALSLRVPALLEQAQDLLTALQYEEAIEIYNDAVKIEPSIGQQEEGLSFFQHQIWLPLTTAKSKDRDILEHIAPELTSVAEKMVAAPSISPFPVTLEYADGEVKAKIFTIGKFVYFQLIEARRTFETGVRLIGKVLSPSIKLTTWEFLQGKKQKLGTIDSLFGSAKFEDVIQTLKTFKVLPL